MKKCSVDQQRAVIAHHQSPEVAQPGERPFHGPAPSVTAQDATILRWRAVTIRAMRRNQQDAPPTQSRSQCVTVVAFISNHARRLLSRTPGAMPSAYPDRRERRLRKPGLRRGCSGKGVSQRKTRAVDHHHPLRAFPPAGFAHSVAPFLAGAKLPSRNDSLHCNCWRSFNSLRNARQMFSQTPCFSQSRSRCQQVDGCGNSPGKSCQRAPLRRIHKMPSSTLRSWAGGRPPCGRAGRFGSKGWIISHCASVSSRPYHGIGPPPWRCASYVPPKGDLKYGLLNALYPVLQLVLGGFDVSRLSQPRATFDSPLLGNQNGWPIGWREAAFLLE